MVQPIPPARVLGRLKQWVRMAALLRPDAEACFTGLKRMRELEPALALIRPAAPATAA